MADNLVCSRVYPSINFRCDIFDGNKGLDGDLEEDAESDIVCMVRRSLLCCIANST